VWEYSRSSWNMVEGGGRAARGVADRPYLVASGCPARSGVFRCLLYLSSVCFVMDNSRNYWYINPLFTLFWNKPCKIINHQNSWKLSHKTPNFLFGDQLHALSWWVVMDVNYHQQVWCTRGLGPCHNRHELVWHFSTFVGRSSFWVCLVIPQQVLSCMFSPRVFCLNNDGLVVVML
jgi:hypothetical protein